MTIEQSELGDALDVIADLSDKLDKALVSAESHQAARGRAVNACMAVVAALERARDVLQRLGQLDEAARVELAIRTALEMSRG